MGNMFHRGPRYACVGLGCAVTNNLLLIGMDAAKIHYAIAVIVSALIMIPLSYYLQLHVTFSVEPEWGAFVRYASALLLNPPISWFLLFLIHDHGGLPMIWAAPIITLIMFIWNFAASNWAIVPHRLQNSRKASS